MPTSTNTTQYQLPAWVNGGAADLWGAYNYGTSRIRNRYGSPTPAPAPVPFVGGYNGYDPNMLFQGGFGGDAGGYNFYQPADPGPQAVPGPTQGGPPDTFVADFSGDTQDAFKMARSFANNATPADMRGIATDVGGYRALIARGLDPNSAPNREVASAISGLDELSNSADPQFDPYSDFTGQNVSAESYDAAQMEAGPGMAAAQVGTVNDIAARRGADMMNAYLNPYTQQVVDTSLADYDVGVDRQANQARARRDASSAFGDRAAIADAVFSADSNRGRGSLSSNLRSQAFNTSAGFGMQDSDRFLEADRSNQQVSLQRQLENSRLAQAAAQANAQVEFNRRQFNTQLDQGTREGNANMRQAASFKNNDTANSFVLANDKRKRDLEMQNFNAYLANNSQRLDAVNARASTAQSQQLNQLNIARGLTDIAQGQSGILGQADAAQQRRIAALTDVGGAIDDRNQAINDEYLNTIQFGSSLLNGLPNESTTTQTTVTPKKKKNLLGKVLRGAIGAASVASGMGYGGPALEILLGGARGATK